MSVRTGRATGLGRGLEALIPHRSQAAGTIDIPLDRIRENPRQPRRRIDDSALATLTASIREHGVIQPILVTETIDSVSFSTSVSLPRIWAAVQVTSVYSVADSV